MIPELNEQCRNKQYLLNNETLGSSKVLPTSLRVIKTEKKRFWTGEQTLLAWKLDSTTTSFHNSWQTDEFSRNSTTHTLRTGATLLQLVDVVFILSTKSQQNYIPGTFQEIPISVYKNLVSECKKYWYSIMFYLEVFKFFCFLLSFWTAFTLSASTKEVSSFKMKIKTIIMYGSRKPVGL